MPRVSVEGAVAFSCRRYVGDLYRKVVELVRHLLTFFFAPEGSIAVSAIGARLQVVE